MDKYTRVGGGWRSWNKRKGGFQQNKKKRAICKRDPILKNDLPDFTIK